MREPGRVSGPTPSERRCHTPRGASFVTSSKDKTTAGESGGEQAAVGRRRCGESLAAKEAPRSVSGDGAWVCPAVSAAAMLVHTRVEVRRTGPQKPSGLLCGHLNNRSKNRNADSDSGVYEARPVGQELGDVLFTLRLI